MGNTNIDASSDVKLNFKEILLRGGVYLAVRQGVGMLVAIVGILLITRIIGPENYGTFAATQGIYTYLLSVGQLGIGVYLIRKKETDNEDFLQAFWVLVFLSLGISAIAVLSTGFLQSWMHLQNLKTVGSLLFPVLFFSLVSAVPIAILEKRFDYKKIATIELVGQVLFYVVAAVSAVKGFGALSLVFGLWAHQVVSFILYFRLAGFVPRWYWDKARLKEMVRYGTSYSVSSWIWRIRDLFIPIMIAPALGAAAAGHIALGIRMTETLGFVKGVGWRISISGIARVQDDNKEILKITQRMALMQVISISVILSGFYLFAPVAVPLFVGNKWLPMLQVFPYIAVAFITGAAFNIMSAAMSVKAHNREVGIFHAAYIFILYLSAAFLIPAFGITGYGLAELAALPTFILLYYFFRKRIGPVAIFKVIVLLIIFSALMFGLSKIQQ